MKAVKTKNLLRRLRYNFRKHSATKLAKMVKRGRLPLKPLFKIAILAVALGTGFLLVDTITTNRAVKKAIASQPFSQTANAAAPTSTAKTDNGINTAQAASDKKAAAKPYAVAADMPRYISAPSLGIYNVPIAVTGKDSSGAIQAPRSYYMAAWFNASAKPGQDGASIIVGHSGPNSMGLPFSHFGKLKNGAVIVVEMGDGTKYTYNVVEVDNVPVQNVDMTKFSNVDGQSVQGLNLATCTQGTYNAKMKEYDHRTLVYTVRVS
ncbi:MAG: class F sortase [Candidatus Nomurabacteria bacterium]|jgi:LPXTG-site transpeptidase (sortase) family protein|nr:class F sortase [Candidatus Nomurabacteria bacterium]